MEEKYRPYPEYTDTGIEWFGRIPAGWEIAALRRSLLEHKQGYYSTDGYVDNGVKLLRITDLRDYGEINYHACPQVSSDDSSLVNYELKDGDVVFARTGGAGSFGVVKNLSERVVFASYLIRFRFSSNRFVNDYLRYMLLAESFQQAVKQNVHGGVNQNIHAEDIKDSYLARPPLEEQQKIANFLDHETAKIDTLIEKQQQLIKLLKEKRQAVISHAVTKGLNPDVPVRDSGVEWLGEVPEHWDFCFLKHKCLEITDGAHVSPETEGGEHYFVSITDIKKGLINFDDALLTTEESYQYLVKTGCMPFPGDILFSKDGTIGQTAITPDGVDFVVASSLIIIRPNRKLVEPRYLDFLLQSGVVVEQVESFVKGAALRRLSIQNLLKVVGSFPPIEEQKGISDFLIKTLSRYDELEMKARLLIRVQGERRTALISAAVTGKIDVRNWQPPSSSPIDNHKEVLV